MIPESTCPLLDAYLELVDDTESPTLFHRWSMLTGVAGMLNRRTKFEMATGAIYPNMYTVLLGPPGAKKSTAISMAGRLIRSSGYMHVASGKTSAEQFLMDLKQGFDAIRMTQEDLDMMSAVSLQETVRSKASHALIQAGEMQDFLGANSISFIGLLTNLWDNPDDYPYRLKNGTNELIQQPTVSLIGGATQSTFKRMFPLDIVGQGLLSRFILVHGAGSRKKVFLPTPPDDKLAAEIVESLIRIRKGSAIPNNYSFTDDAFDFSKTLYEGGSNEITDPRFEYYTNRRNDHYMKLCMVIAAMNMHDSLHLDDCILANTILSYTEKFMPQALGEFGLDQAAEHTEYLYKLISNSPNGLSLSAIAATALSIFKSAGEIAQHLAKLIAGKRVEKISIQGKTTYISIDRRVSSKSKMLDFELLCEFRENPTFHTDLKSNQPSALEAEIAKEAKEVIANTPDLQKLRNPKKVDIL